MTSVSLLNLPSQLSVLHIGRQNQRYYLNISHYIESLADFRSKCVSILSSVRYRTILPILRKFQKLEEDLTFIINRVMCNGTFQLHRRRRSNRNELTRRVVARPSECLRSKPRVIVLSFYALIRKDRERGYPFPAHVLGQKK